MARKTAEQLRQEAKKLMEQAAKIEERNFAGLGKVVMKEWKKNHLEGFPEEFKEKVKSIME